MAKLTPVEALARLTLNDVKNKPEDLNMFDDPNEYYQELGKEYPDLEALHQMVIVGKGKVEENQSIFDGSTWQSYTGGDTNVLEPYPFNELPTKKKVDIRYMGWTAKTDVEIEQIADEWKKEHPVFSGTGNCQTFALHLVPEIISNENIKPQ
ncbi:hypothetical protein MMC34_001974 [Xylographa carneopallida]|nr:hypothetical protein [Xylographa carneopallida]